MGRLTPVVLGLAAALVLVPTTAVADNATHTYVLEMEHPNLGVAANGDMVSITGHADFSVNPNGIIDASGSFTHTHANGAVVGSGTWEATGLLNYQSYGCGVVLGDESLPDNLCGGAVKMRVVLTTPLGELPATMTIICVIGPNPPDSIFGPRTEGGMLDVPGVINFNHSVGGDNFIIQVS